MKRIHNKGFIILCLCALIIGIGYLFYKKFYLKPQAWKKLMAHGIKTKAVNIPDSLINRYCDCVYDGFKDQYGNISRFPSRNNYTQQDKITIMSCTIEYLVLDSATKERARSRIDSLAAQL